MKVDPLQQRVYRARKKGLTIKQIAAKEGLPPTTVYELCSGPRFIQNLLRHQEAEAIRSVNNAAKLNAVVEARLTQISEEPEAVKKLMATARDIKDAVHAMAALQELGMEVLADQLRDAKQADDPRIAAVRKLLETKAKQRLETATDPPATMRDTHF